MAEAKKSEKNRAPEPAESISELSFEEALSRLESIVNELKGEEVPLEKAFELWEEGQKLHAHCTGILDRLKRRLEQAASPTEKLSEEDEEEEDAEAEELLYDEYYDEDLLEDEDLEWTD